MGALWSPFWVLAHLSLKRWVLGDCVAHRENLWAYGVSGGLSPRGDHLGSGWSLPIEETSVGEPVSAQAPRTLSGFLYGGLTRLFSPPPRVLAHLSFKRWVLGVRGGIFWPLPYKRPDGGLLVSPHKRRQDGGLLGLSIKDQALENSSEF